MIEHIIIAVIVAGAGLFLLRRWLGKDRGTCGCGRGDSCCGGRKEVCKGHTD